MYKLCKTEQSAARQQQMELGLLALMKQRRYDDISVSDLCQSLGITRKAFYRYFTGKDGCLYALLDHTMLEFFQHNTQSPTRTGTAIGDLDQFFLFWYDHRELLDALEKSSLGGMLVERATSLALSERLMPKYVLSWAADLQGVAMTFAISGLLAMVTRWHAQGFAISPKEMNRLATDLLTKPLIRL